MNINLIVLIKGLKTLRIFFYFFYRTSGMYYCLCFILLIGVFLVLFIRFVVVVVVVVCLLVCFLSVWHVFGNIISSATQYIQ